MGSEIERKFLLSSEAWRDEVSRSVAMSQGYLASGGACTVRVRITGDSARLNLKSGTFGISRAEFEYEIPITDAREILDRLCRGPIVAKTRHHVERGDHLFEIDEFEGANAGLVVAEVELASEDEEIDLPPWIGEEVSGDARYYNANLAERPYREWR